MHKDRALSENADYVFLISFGYIALLINVITLYQIVFCVLNSKYIENECYYTTDQHKLHNMLIQHTIYCIS